MILLVGVFAICFFRDDDQDAVNNTEDQQQEFISKVLCIVSGILAS